MTKLDHRDILKVRESSKRSSTSVASHSRRPPKARALNIRLLGITVILVIAVGPGLYLTHRIQFQRNADLLLDRARAYEAEGQYQKAIRAFEQHGKLFTLRLEHVGKMIELVEKTNPTTLPEKRNLARLFAQSLDLDPSQPDVRRKFAEILVEVGSLQKAKEEADTLLETNKEDVVALRVKADVLAQAGKFAEAAARYQDVVQLAPTDQRAYTSLAQCYWLAEEKDKALGVVDVMIEKLPSCGEAYLLRYQYRLAAKSPTYPVIPADLEAAIRHAPDNLSILLAAAGDAYRHGKLATAGDYYRRVLDVAAKGKGEGLAQAYLGLGNTEAAAGRRDAAVKVWLNGIEKVGSTIAPELNIRLAETYLERGQVAEAFARVRILRDSLTSYANARRRKVSDLTALTQTVDWLEARCYLGGGEEFKAMPFLIAAGMLSTGDSTTTLNALHRLGAAYANLRQWDAAIDCYRRIAILRPESLDNQRQLAKTLVAAGRFDEAAPVVARIAGDRNAQLSDWITSARTHLRRQLQLAPPQRSWNEYTRDLQKLKAAGAPIDDLATLEAGRLLLVGQSKEADELLLAGQLLLLASLPGQLQTDGMRLVQFIATYRRLPSGDTRSLPVVRRIEQVLTLAVARLELQRTNAAKSPSPHAAVLALALAPVSGKLLLNTASNLASQNQFDKAVALLDAGESVIAQKDLRELESLKLWLLQNQGNTATLNAEFAKWCGKHPRDLQRLAEWCEQLMRAGERETAKSKITALRELEGPTGTLWRALSAQLLLISAKRTKADLEDASQLVADVLARRPGWPQAHQLSAEVHQLRGESDKALAALKQAVKVGGDDPELFRRLLDLLIRRGDLREAEVYLARIRQSMLTSTTLAPAALQVSLSKRDFGVAERLALAAIAKRPKDMSARIWLGIVFDTAQQFDKAEKAYRDAIAIDRQSVSAHVQLIRFLAQRGNKAAAEKALNELQTQAKIERHKDLVVGYCQALVGKVKEARQTYEHALRENPNDPLIKRNVASFYLAHAMPEAQKLLDELRQQSPEDPILKRALAVSLGAKSDAVSWQEGLDLLAGADESVDLRLRAMLLERLGGPDNHKEAIRLLTELVGRREPNDADDRYRLARLLAANREWNKAAEIMIPAVSQERVDSGKRAFCVDLLLKARKWEGEAAAQLALLEQVDASSVQTAALRIRWLIAANRRNEALTRAEHFVGQKKSDADGLAHALLGLAQAFELAGAMDAAEDFYQRLDAATPAGYQHHFLFLTHQGRGDKAAQLCFTRIDAPQSKQSLEALVLCAGIGALAKVSTSVDEQIEARLQNGLKQHASAAALLSAIAERRLRQGRFEESAVLYQRCRAIDPSNIVLLNNLALAQAKSKRNNEALETINKAIQLAGPKLELLDSKGMILTDMGDYAGAIAVLSKVTLDPRAAPVHYLHLAHVFAKANRSEESRMALQKAREKNIDKQSLPADESQMLQNLLDSEAKSS